MFSKYWFNLLLFFTVWTPINHFVQSEDTIIVKLDELVKQPGWSSIKDVNPRIIYDGRMMKTDIALQFFNRDNISANNSEYIFDNIVRQISIMLSCEYTKQLRQYVALVQGIIDECKDPRRNDAEIDCKKLLVDAINCTEYMVREMLSSLTYFYQVSRNATDFRQVYVALMTIKQYVENNLHTEVRNKIEEIERLSLLVDLRVQTFAVGHCVPPYLPLWSSEIYKRCEPARSIRKHTGTRNTYTECLSETVNNLVNTFNSDYFAALGFENSGLDIVSTKADLDAVWVLLNSQQPESYSTRIRWLDGANRVPEDVNVVKYQYDINQLASFQKATLKAVAQIFYKQISETVEAAFKGHEKTVDEGLCPPNFLLALTNSWPGLKKLELAAIKEACISLRGVKTKEECTEKYLESLKTAWLYFSGINVPAVTTACTATLRGSQTGVMNMFGSGIISNVRSYMKVKKENSVELINDNLEFWDELKSVLKKLTEQNFFNLPVETTETLKTILEHLENMQIVNEQQVLKLVELEMKNATADFIEENPVNVDPKKRLQSLIEFTDNMINNSEPIKRVSLNNGLMWSTFGFEQTKLLLEHTSSEVTENWSNDKFCRLSGQVVKTFKVIYEFASARLPVILNNMVNAHLDQFAAELQHRVPKLVKIVFHHMPIIPTTETVSLRNALILLKLFVIDYEMSVENRFELWQSEKFQRLILLIINQVDIYIVQNCVIDEYERDVWSDEEVYCLHTYKTLYGGPITSVMTAIDDELAILNDESVINECEVNMSNATFEKLVSSKLHKKNPLKYVQKYKFTWQRNYETLETIRNMVVTSGKLETLTKYQVLVQNSLTATLFGYMLNIFEAAKSPEGFFTYEHKQLILSKIQNVYKIVYPNSKTESLKFIINTFLWCFEGNNISLVKANILAKRIDRELNAYDMDTISYYNTLKRFNKIRDEGKDGIDKYVRPLEQFADEWIMMIKKDMNCVRNYMMVTL